MPSSVQRSGSQAWLADVEKHGPRGVGKVGRMAAGELEQQPGVDRAEDGARRHVDVAQQPLDLRPRRDRGRGPGRCARGPGARNPLERSSAQRAAVRRSCQTSALVDRLAAVGVPGDDGLALVGDPDRLEVPGSAISASASASRAHSPGRLPDLVRRRARPSPGAESAGRTRCRRGPRSRPRRRRPGRWCRSFPGRSRGSPERLSGVGLGSAYDRQECLGEPGDVFFPGPESAQGQPIHQGHDRAGMAPGIGHLERGESRLRDFFVGDEAAPRRVLELGIPGRAEVQLDLGQLFDPAVRLACDPLDLDRNLLDARGAPGAQVRGDPLEADRPPRRPAASGTRARGRAGCRSGR